MPFEDAIYFGKLIEDLDRLAERRLEGQADHSMTGLLMLLNQMMVSVIHSMTKSYAYAIVVITPLMMLLVGSLRRGLVSMVPNLLPVLATVGMMGWLGIPLDSTTMLIGAMVIGLAVDDTIHFMHKFQRYFDDLRDFEGAVRETLRTSGSALLFTSLVLAGGFGVFTLSEMANSRAFGMLASFAALVAFTADLLIAPGAALPGEPPLQLPRVRRRPLRRRAGPGDRLAPWRARPPSTACGCRCRWSSGGSTSRSRSRRRGTRRRTRRAWSPAWPRSRWRGSRVSSSGGESRPRTSRMPGAMPRTAGSATGSDVGRPDPRRLVRASRRAERVSLFAFGSAAPRWWEASRSELEGIANLTVTALPEALIAGLEADLERTVEWSFTSTEGTLFVETARGTLETRPELWQGPL